MFESSLVQRRQRIYYLKPSLSDAFIKLIKTRVDTLDSVILLGSSHYFVESVYYLYNISE